MKNKTLNAGNFYQFVFVEKLLMEESLNAEENPMIIRG
jgi:hypothetical protein